MNRRQFLAGCAAAPVLPCLPDLGPSTGTVPHGNDLTVLRRVVECWYSTWIRRLRKDPTARPPSSLKASALVALPRPPQMRGTHGYAIFDDVAFGNPEPRVSAGVIDALMRLGSSRAIVYSGDVLGSWGSGLPSEGGVILIGDVGRSIVHEAMGVVARPLPSDAELIAMRREEHVRAIEDHLASVIWFAPDGDGHRWAGGERFLERLDEEADRG